MPEGEKKFRKNASLFPTVTDPKLFGHDGDAEIEKKRRGKDALPDTRADWYGDDERAEDAGPAQQELDVEKEQEELKDRRPK